MRLIVSLDQLDMDLLIGMGKAHRVKFLLKDETLLKEIR